MKGMGLSRPKWTSPEWPRLAFEGCRHRRHAACVALRPGRPPRGGGGGGGSGERHMPGGRRPLDPANGGVTEDWGQFVLRIKEDLVSASAPSPRVQMQARCVCVVPAPSLTDHP